VDPPGRVDPRPRALRGGARRGRGGGGGPRELRRVVAHCGQDALPIYPWSGGGAEREREREQGDEDAQRVELDADQMTPLKNHDTTRGREGGGCHRRALVPLRWHHRAAPVPVMGAQATSVWMEMPASMERASGVSQFVGGGGEEEIKTADAGKWWILPRILISSHNSECETRRSNISYAVTLFWRRVKESEKNTTLWARHTHTHTHTPN